MLKSENSEQVLKTLFVYEIHGIVLEAIIGYCYTGCIELNASNALSIWRAATRLEFVALQEKCFKFFSENLTATNCLVVLITLWNKADFSDLYRSAKSCVEMHFDALSKTPEFLQLPHLILSEILESDNLNVYSEEDVFNALATWVHRDENERKQNVWILLPAIRLIHIRSKVSRFSINCIR